MLPNHKIKIGDIDYKVCGGDGFDPSYLKKFIGKIIKKKLSKDAPLLIANIRKSFLSKKESSK